MYIQDHTIVVSRYHNINILINILSRASDSCLMLDYVRVINFRIIIIRAAVRLKIVIAINRAIKIFHRD